ncbi:SOS response-associated peptidase [Bacillus solimangrovi]|uniref:Abasic site processing protein n=1 Tax=Bacillus solimangrovi TaxID=1305675 RepID=A0A1E5LJ06_9BACI|nr:SOS response-associated peptidase [Bacillus solimangrovi]OEH94079.1 hypothetical protein BFG57_09540 [Bacillus solimangrovi]
MCGRFTLFTNYEEIIKRFNIEAGITEDQYRISYNIAPSQPVLSVINDGHINRIGFLKWGLVPPWAKNEQIGYKMINARGETLTEKPSFRNAYKKKRCLIIADSFYEWKRNEDKTKTPMRIKLKSGELFAMAGLWEQWKSPAGETIYSCSIITTKPNELVSHIHDRMPVIIKPNEEVSWLNPNNNDTDILNRLLKPYPAHLMEAYPVSTLVNSPKNNTLELIHKIG